MHFTPIAIVGQGCILPGAHSPQALWDVVQAGRSTIGAPPQDYWGVPRGRVMGRVDDAMDRTWSDQGGYIRDLHARPTLEGLAIDRIDLGALDPLFVWALAAARQALQDAKMSLDVARPEVGVILGNLSYPTPGLARLAETVWAGRPVSDQLALERFMSGLPAQLVARALNLGGQAYCLDAACASSLYAIKLACEALQDGRADVMLAGGINHADDLFLHVGFCALNAMSKSGRSRPFHRDADGLVPAEGAGFVVLKRLDDALSSGDHIHGVIRGVGLSNDGRGRGMLTPSEEGQVRAMRAAYEMSGLDPATVSLIECHATGTPLGDATELRSMSRIFEGRDGVPIGSLKGNMGHLITASGVAGLLKVTASMRHGMLPPVLHTDAPNDLVANSPFRIVKAPEPWQPAPGAPRRAVVNNFGFGGNNAHLLVEQFDPDAPRASAITLTSPPTTTQDDVAIVAIGMSVGPGHDSDALMRAILNDATLLDDAQQARLIEVGFDLRAMKFPPNDLKQTLPQQLLAMRVGLDLGALLETLPPERTGVLMGMQCDAEIARYGARWRLAAHLDGDALDAAREQIVPGLHAAGVVGTMPNIVANRLNSQLSLMGPSYTVSAEELSGAVALDTAARALRHGELDAAVVGAVDLCCEPVHQVAARHHLPDHLQTPADAAVVLVLKRLADATRDGDEVIAVLPAQTEAAPQWRLSLSDADAGLTARMGHAHAASGLLHIAAAALCLRQRFMPGEAGAPGQPWLPRGGRRTAEVTISSFGGITRAYALRDAPHAAPLRALAPQPRLWTFQGDSLAALRHAVQTREVGADAASAWRASVVWRDEDDLSAKLQALLARLRDDAPLPDAYGEEVAAGVMLGQGALEGEVAFVFTGPAGAYPGMGRDLALALPELVDGLSDQFDNMDEAVGWLFDPNASRDRQPVDKLWGSSFLCQLHARLTRHVLQLKPQAAIGFCSGETNALFAMGAWRGLDAMHRDIEDRGVFSRALGGDLDAVRAHWETPEGDPVRWASWRVLAPEDQVREALASEPRAHLTIVSAPGDLVIAGDADACERVVAQVGANRCRDLGYNVVMHCPEAGPFRDAWRDLHHRPTQPVPGVRFYTNATLDSYDADADRVADALTGQAMGQVDFPALVARAWEDGVRVFVEHGPHAGCTQWIGRTLNAQARPHLALALDRYGSSATTQALLTSARLFAAGVAGDYLALEARLAPAPARPHGARTMMMTFPGHLPPVVYPTLPDRTDEAPVATQPTTQNVTPPLAASAASSAPTDGDAQTMRQAPTLPSVRARGPVPSAPVAQVAKAKAPAPAVSAAPAAPVAQAPAASAPAAQQAPAPVQQAPVQQAPVQQAQQGPLLDRWMSMFEHVSTAHEAFLTHQTQAQRAFMDTRAELASIVLQGASSQPTTVSPAAQAVVSQVAREVVQQAAVSAPQPTPAPASAPARAAAPVAQPLRPTTPVAKPVTPTLQAKAPAPASAPARAAAPAPAAQAKAPQAPTTQPVAAKPSVQAPVVVSGQAYLDEQQQARAAKFKPTKKRAPVGLRLDRDQLKVHASGNISEIYGPLFKQQDQYALQVRMPEPPLLLADRVTGIDAEPGVHSTGTMWTETDVRWDSWYLNEGRMPTGIMIESGQADLMLISWMGADFKNKGERAYRLLGCDLMFHGGLARPGETLVYDIHIDGHAKQDDIRLFFFHYDCTVGDAVRLSVRNGQAGFFTYEELAASKGILWRPEEETLEGGRMDTPKVMTSKRSFAREELESFTQGRPWETFGPEFWPAQTHTRTPRVQGGDMLFMDEVTHFEPEGGPWGRGYMRAVQHIRPDFWFFNGHFKNDPCMPGTLMFEGCVQALSFYMAGLGMTLEYDGAVFEPVPFELYPLRCRGQVSTTSKELVYELFIREVHLGPEPRLYADLLCTVDGLRAFHCARMGLRLSPAWPMDRQPELLEGYVEPKPVAEVDGFKFDYASLLACAWGKPSDAFGPRYERFDSHRRVARLPGPPYHFISRVTRVDEPMAAMRSGVTVEMEYDVPPDAWYFQENGAAVMPLAVLMEAALQPCGWLASYVGCALSKPIDLFFRNLDGTGTQHAEVTPQTGTLRTDVKLKTVAQAGGTIIVAFDVAMRAPEHDDQLIFTMDTVFGFFPKEALATQAGLVPVAGEREWVFGRDASDEVIDLTERPARFCEGSARLAEPMLLMLDRLTGAWPEAGAAGLGRYRAEKAVDPGEWFFKAHFYQDPVQPGSLGIEALLQLVQAAALHRGLHLNMRAPRFEAVAIAQPLKWSYRGQVMPHNKVITSSVEINAIHEEPNGGVLIVATGALWVDGMKIYGATNLAMRLVEADGPFDPGSKREDSRDDAATASTSASASASASSQGAAIAWASQSLSEAFALTLASDPWLEDHRPTYTAPAAPMMSALDWMAQAAQRLAPTAQVIALTDARMMRWITVSDEARLKVDAQVIDAARGEVAVTLSRWWDAPNPALSRFEPCSSATVRLGARFAPDASAPQVAPLAEGEPLPDLYEGGALFHGPSLQVVSGGLMGARGADGQLTAHPDSVPRGLLCPAWLDGALQVIPHDQLGAWSGAPEVDDLIGYPHAVEQLTVYGPAPAPDATPQTRVRFVTLREGRFPVFDIAIFDGDRCWLTMRLVEILMPKGRLGHAAPLDRRAFLRDRRWVEGVGLSSHEGGVTRLTRAEVKASDWFRGTMAATYGVSERVEEATWQIAAKEHVARMARVHPSQLEVDAEGVVTSRALPWQSVQVSVQVSEDGAVQVSSGGWPGVDVAPLQAFWRERLDVHEGWFGDDLYGALVRSFVRSVRLEDPAGLAALQGRSVLFLANHQVQIESLLITALASCLTGRGVVTLANAKHEQGWVGRLVRQVFAYPGCGDPQNIVYFRQQEREQLLGLIEDFKRDVRARGVSVMVHAAGDRERSSDQRVEKVSSMFLDMALDLELPIVPVSFQGGLPLEPVRGAKLEFPVGLGSQDYVFGAPIMPETLGALGYVQRRDLVLARINALADGARQLTWPSDPALIEASAGFEAMGLDAVSATIAATLAAQPEQGPATRALLAALSGDAPEVDDALGAWVEGMVATLRS